MAKLVRGDTNQGREEREKEIGSWGHEPRQRILVRGDTKKEKRKLVRGDTNQDREEREKEIGSWGHEPRRSGGTQTKAVYVEQNM